MAVHLVSRPKSGTWQVLAAGVPVSAANRFLASLKVRGLSNLTIRAYGFDLVAFYRWFETTDLRVESLQQAHLLAFIDNQRQAGIRPRSINRRLSTIRTFYRYCTGEDMPMGKGVTLPPAHYKRARIDHNLGIFRLKRRAHRVLQVQEPHVLIEPLGKEQVTAFLGTLKRYRDLAIVHLMLLCGLRVGEVLKLKMQDVRFDEKTIRVQGKGTKERNVPLPPVVVSIIENYIRFERPDRTRCNRLFVVMQGKHRGQAMTYQGLRSIFRRRRRSKALRNANPHSWRHTCGTDLARSGVGIVSIKTLLGHADIQTTAQYINLSMTDIALEYQKASAEILARYKCRGNEE